MTEERSRNLVLINISKRMEMNPPIQRGEGEKGDSASSYLKREERKGDSKLSS
jgi:hypothetical protein